jgi:hypothetical protein
MGRGMTVTVVPLRRRIEALPYYSPSDNQSDYDDDDNKNDPHQGDSHRRAVIATA